MKWAYLRGRCISLTDSEVDVLCDILAGTHEALRQGFAQMEPSELVDFNNLCAEAGLTVLPLNPDAVPGLRRIK